MNKWVKIKDFENLFRTYNETGKQIWVVGRVKKLPLVIVTMALNLLELDFIRFVCICNETLAASSENYPKRPKIPVTRVDHPTAIGIQILYSVEFKVFDFFDINSPVKGNGSKMVDAILKNLPKDWQPTVVMDLSNGFWDKMIKRHSECTWMCDNSDRG